MCAWLVPKKLPDAPMPPAALLRVLPGVPGAAATSSPGFSVLTSKSVSFSMALRQHSPRMVEEINSSRHGGPPLPKPLLRLSNGYCLRYETAVLYGVDLYSVGVNTSSSKLGCVWCVACWVHRREGVQ